MTVKELIQQSGMKRKAFADYFGIPDRNVQNWISDSPTSGRNCPEYLISLMLYKLRKEGIIEDK